MIKIEFNAAPIFRSLEQAQAKLADMTPLYQDITEYMVTSTRDRFKLGTDPEGKKWAPKKPATIARYEARGDGIKRDPLIGPSGRLSREIIGISTRASSEIGSSLEYSGVMQNGAARGAFGRSQRGGPIPWGTIPARVWLGISPANERDILAIVDEYLAEIVDD
ncbi:phage virion morphogenesis protein [Sphingomonas panni]|uniref:phage virion morphogenesis protein n=1 Tax=Sphingomonas panni TaxID=237612 RepID=UPI001F5BF789|nr:phage virion morphogenesis protein [Sphingomonas panni]